jgi:hypothetical protein
MIYANLFRKEEFRKMTPEEGKVIRYNVGLYQIDIIETSTRFEIWVYCETCGTRDLVFDFDKETEG